MVKSKTVYTYNEVNYEYQSSQIVVGSIPEFSTTKQPPELGENKVAIFSVENDEWIVEDDYRFTHKMIDEELNIFDIEEIGAIPEDMYLVVNEVADAILENKENYIIEDGIVREKTEEELKEDRHNKLKMYSMTKLDFSKYVLKPNGISYGYVLQLIEQNEDLKETWELCSRVFRGDGTLCATIEQLLPSVTSEILDDLFEQYGKLVLD